MSWNRTNVSKVIIAIAMIGIIAAVVVVAKYSSDTPAKSVAAQKDQTVAPRTATPGRTFKVLFVMSYHTPWEWTESQFKGFKEGMGDLKVEYKTYEMDAKRRSSEQWLTQAAGEAQQLIAEWKPDLVCTSDDAAQQRLAVKYNNGDIPFVFCAVNADPRDYGFDEAKNVAGVLEREHFAGSVRLLKELVPNMRKIAIITDTGKMWPRVIKRMKADEGRLGGVRVVGYNVIETFEQYKQAIQDYEGKVDAVGLLGIFEFKGADGKNVPYQEVARWTAENSNLPDFSFWVDRVDYGTLCAMTVSGFNQGLEAGKLARQILADGKAPSSLPMEPTTKGEPVINLARARRLGLVPGADILLTARVMTKYAWND